MWTTLLLLLMVGLVGWAVTATVRATRRAPGPQQQWEHWLEASGLRPVPPRTAPVVALARAAGRQPDAVGHAAMGRAADGAVVVVTRLVDGTVLVAAQRSGPAPTHAATTLVDGWQVRTSRGPLAEAWADADWLRTGPTTVH